MCEVFVPTYVHGHSSIFVISGVCMISSAAFTVLLKPCQCGNAGVVDQNASSEPLKRCPSFWARFGTVGYASPASPMHPCGCVGTLLGAAVMKHGRRVCTTLDSSLKGELEQGTPNPMAIQHVSTFWGPSNWSRTWATHRDGPPTEHQRFARLCYAVWLPDGRSGDDC
mmetsp:Transcript_88180/g.153184  ORF Transcript_88180/g.153184 Transcript_88180/m.153184 type:complete len:168 (+) Transcript_88180:587-1090(+)